MKTLSKVIGKVKTGVKGAVTSPTRFIVSLGIGFAIGVIADLIMEFITNHYIPQLRTRQELGFQFWITGQTSIAYDDIILLAITILMLFSKKFVTTLGFFLGWYFSSAYGFYGALNIGELVD